MAVKLGNESPVMSKSNPALMEFTAHWRRHIIKKQIRIQLQNVIVLKKRKYKWGKINKE